MDVVSAIRELPDDTLTVTSAFARVGEGRPSFVLERVEAGVTPTRYAYLFFNPYLTLRVRGGALVTEGLGKTIREEGKPLERLKAKLESFRRAAVPGLPPFACGAVGYLAYDCVRYLENIPMPEGDDEDEACFVLFRNVLVFDRVRSLTLLVSNGFGDLGKAGLHKDLEKVERALRTGQTRRPLAPTGANGLASGGEKDLEASFFEAVSQVKNHIRRGDIFQCVLSQRLTLPFGHHPFALYRELRGVNPSPYHFYFDSGKETLVGASPEALVSVDSSNVVTTCPIAGTRPRGATPAEDKRLEKNLCASTKEKAEHLMLVDLSRNDIGRVCRPGTVRVTEFMGVQRFSHVMHLVSKVQGRLRAGKKALDALFASFPAGTLTGAPKIRAMEIISRLETERRGAYGGAVVLYDFDGTLDSCITIRSAILKNGTARVQAGAGIVADSKAERELEEIRSKCGAVRRAIALVGGAK